MPILSKSAGTVIAVWGKAFYHLPNGKLVPVKVGDHIEGGEAILTSQDGIVKIAASDGPTVLLKAKLAASDTDKVINGLNNDELDFNTAAGLQGGGGGGLLPGLRVDRVSESVTGQEYQYSTERAAPTVPFAAVEQPLYPAAEVAAPLVPILRVLSDPVLEGQDAVFSVQLNVPSAETITFSLSLRPGLDPATSATLSGNDADVGEVQYFNSATNQWVTYVAGSELTFKPGETEVLVRVLTKDDSVRESLEYFILNAHVTSGTVQNVDDLGQADASNEITLIDNEAPPLTARVDPGSDSGTVGDGITSDSTPTISGTGEPGNEINVVMPGTGETLTATVQPDGSWSVTPLTEIPSGTTGTVQVTATDLAGDSVTVTVPLSIDNVTPAVLTAQIDPSSDSGVQGDGITSDATPTISGTGDPGAQIKVTMPGTGEALTTTVQSDGSWSVIPTQAIPNGTTGQVQVTETDAAGNATQTTVPLSVDTGVPNNGAAPTVTIMEDANNDGFVNKAELNGNVDVKVAFTPAQVGVGDVVKVTSGGVTNAVTITAQDKANGFVSTTFTAPANGTTMTVSSHIEDSAGNVSLTGSDSAKLDLSTLTGLSISLTTDANDDGFINQSELAGGQTAVAQVKLPADAVAGDLLTVTSTGSSTQTITLTQSHIDAGQLQLSVTVPASGTELKVTAQVSDAAGNQSALATDQAVVATDAILAPKVTIGEDANNDGFINKAELSGNIDVSVALPTAAKVGDSLLVSANGASQAPIVLTQADIDKGSVAIPGIASPGEGSTLTVTAQVKDVAGNLGATGSDSAKVDTTAPAVLTAQLDPASDSGTQGDGITNDATPTISGTGDPGAQIKVTMPGTGEVLTTTVLQNGTWTVTPTQDIPNGTTGPAQVTETDAAGNTTQTTVSLSIDTGVPNNGAAPTVTITEDANNDGFINKAELNGNVDVKVAFDGTKVNIGDVVKVTSGDVTKDIVITLSDVNNGFVTTTFAAPANGTTMTVTSHIEDSAGNVSDPGTDSAKLDLSTLSGLGITLSTDANNDGFINKVELAGGQAVQAQVKLPVDAAAGDALSITATGNAPQSIILTQAQIDAGQVQVSLTAPPSGTDLVATAQVSDAAGNQSAMVSDHAIIATDDISAPKVTITTDANNDGFINQAEQGANATIGVQIDLPGTAKAGDSLLVSINGASKTPILLTQADIDNHSVAIPGVTNPGDGSTLTVTAQVKDLAGNLGATGTDSAKIDTTAYTGLGVSITTDGNNDGYISEAELTDNTIGVRVTLPVGAAAGDTLSVMGSGNVAQVIPLTTAQLTAGFVDLKFNPTADNTDFVVTASIVDAAGNSAGPVSDAARLQLGVPGAPIVTIGEDANNDGFINKAELSGNIDVSVALPATAKAGDSLLVSANDVLQAPIVLTQADIDKGSVAIPGIASPGEGSTLTVTAQVKDVAGNLGAAGSDSAKVDTTAPAILTAQLDPASDSGIQGDGITNDATPTISGTGDAGAQIKVTMPGTGEVLTTTVLQNGTWTVTPTQDIPNGTAGPAQVTETDAAGNTTQTTVSLNIDTGVPNNGAAPTVTITEDANNDGFINKAELNGNVDVKVAFNPAQVNIGDVVKVTSGGVTKDVAIMAQDQTNGFVTTSVTPAAEGTTMTVTAVIVDAAGNTSAPGTDSAKLDTTAYTGLGVSITTDGNNDGYISKAELTDNTIGVRVTLPAGAAAGDTLSVMGSGNVAQVITLTTAQLTAGFVDLKFNPTADNTDFVATASIVDAAGNSAGPVSDAARLQLGVPGAPIVTIGEDANNDGFINQAELSGNIDVSAALPATAKAGDSLLVSANDVLQAPIVLTQADIDKGSVAIPGIASPGEGSSLTVTAQVKDVAGNLGAAGSDSAKVDTTAPAILTAQLDPASDSGIQGDGITNDATPTISGTGDAGAQIKVTMPGTGEVLTTTVLQNGTWTVTPTQDIPNGTAGSAQVTETDAAGNTTQTTVSLNIDTGVPNNGAAPTVTITEDANNDGFINKAELNGNVDVKVAFDGAKVNIGDVVKVTSGDATKDIVITLSDVNNGFVTTTFAAPANGTTMTVTSHIEDSAGNISGPGTDSAKLDLSTLSGLGITLSTDTNNDSFINKAELAGGQVVQALVKLPVDAAAGDILNVTATGNAAQAITLTQAQIDAGQVQVSLTAPASGTDLVATAQVSDAAGNQSAMVSDHAVIATDDISAPKVTITTDANNDGFVNKAELGAGSTIAVSVELPTTAKAGDSLLVSVNGAEQSPILLTQANIDSHSVVIPGLANPGEGANLLVTAQVKDLAGNLGAIGTDSAKIDTTAYTGLGVSITTDGNNDGYISKAELTDNTIGVRVTLPAGAAAGDTLSVMGSGNVAQVINLTTAQLTAGFVDLKFNPTADNTDFVATASIVDAAGNSAGPVSDAARLQLGVPGAPIVTIGEDANNDGFINQAELSGNIDVSVALPATAKAGDSLLVSANGAPQNPILLTQADIDKGSVAIPGIASPGEGSSLTVTAQVKDVAGNMGATGSDSAKVDTTAPAVLTAQLDPVSDSGTQGDGITNDATPTISGTGDPGAQIKVTMPGTGEVLTTTVLQNGTWTVTPTQDIPNGTTGPAQVTETDAAGNTTQTTVSLNIDTGVPNNGAAPTVTITEDANNDGFINKAELNGNVDVKVAFDGTKVNIGDVVKVTSGGVTNDVTITAQDQTNGFVSTSVTPAAEGTTMTVTAVIVDAAGNTSTTGTDSAKIDTSPAALDLDADNSSGITGTGYTTSYTEGAAPVRLSDVDISLSSSHPMQLTGATVKLTNAQAGDVLSVVDALPSGITATVTGTTVTLSGMASLADYQSAIRDIGFSSTSRNPSTVNRTVEVVVTDGTSLSNTAQAVVQVTAVNDAPVIGNAVGHLSEEGLPGGLKDSTGVGDDTDSATVSGQITMSDADSTITSVTLSAPTDPVLTASGQQVVWTSDGHGGLIGKDGAGASASTVFTVSIDNAGNYSAQLLAPLHHSLAGEDILNLSFGVTASDGAKTGQGNLTIQVQDDAPGVLGPVTNSVVTINTNLLLTLDVSGSMNEVIDGGTQTRLQLAVASIKTLLDKYDQIGDVAVRLVTFSSNAQTLGSTWLTVSAAKSLLAAITANGSTNYDAGLNTAQTAFNTASGKLAGAQNVGYFFSDGNPTVSGTNSSEEASWVKFLNDNQIKSYAIGLGAGVSATYLNPIAHDGQAGENLNGTVVTNLSQLDAVLSGTVKEAAVGKLFTAGSVMDLPGGADGFSHVQSITIDGRVYNYDAANPVITVATSVGSLTLHMDTGEYTYAAPGGQGASGLTETFTYSLADGDGDTTSSTLTIMVEATNVQAGTTAIDTFNGTSGADILMGREGNDIMSGGLGDDRVYGNAGNDVINGGDGHDTLNGGLGNDNLNGGNGNDILLGGPGSDVLTGGLGSDTFAWHFADPGVATTLGRAVDTIKDFNVAPVADGGDVLDLRDLLQGENTTGGSGNLHNYLDFDTSTPGSTVVHISATGGFSNGTYTSGQETQRIVLEGVNLRTDMGLASTATDDQVIVKLLQQNKLLVDG